MGMGVERCYSKSESMSPERLRTQEIPASVCVKINMPVASQQSSISKIHVANRDIPAKRGPMKLENEVKHWKEKGT